jgi:xylose isomerase
MSKDPRFSAGIWAFTSAVDRFATAGYRDDIGLEQKIEMCGRTRGLDGVILQYPAVVNDDNVDRVERLLADNGLEVAQVDAVIFDRPYQLGSFTNPDAAVRKKAVEEAKRTVDTAKRLGARNVGLWLGQDGYDYLFQVDYREVWKREVDGVRQVAEYDPAMRLCFEYKLREPRMFLTVPNVGTALQLCQDVGKENVGFTVDVGHCFMARENPAEAAAHLMMAGRLFGAHFNDTYGVDDDDLIAGSVHIPQLLELLLYLDEMGYDDWYGLDYFPYREDPVRAAELSIDNVKSVREIALTIDREKLRQAQAEGSGIAVQQYIRDILYRRA